MIAIVKIAGKQYKVVQGQELFVNKIDAEEGSSVDFNEVLLTTDGSSTAIGTPTLSTSVKATVVEHLKDKKVIVFKKKRRKGYRVKNGHRQQLTRIKIDAIA